MPTKIEWCDETWNPTTGCNKISPGCKNCYAKRDWTRLSQNSKTVYFGRKFEDVQTHSERLETPLRWTKPRRIFVNSMSDLFHVSIPQHFIQEVWVTMALARARGHIFQVLTKRADQMLQSVMKLDVEYVRAIYDAATVNMPAWEWPLPNVWLGVSVEDQERADERIPELLKVPAAVRFLSCEPLLGPIGLTMLHHDRITNIDCLRGLHGIPIPHAEGPKVDWVIVGGESGPNARPMHPEWARSLRDQCQSAGVPYHFKQWGEWTEELFTDEHAAIPDKRAFAFDESGLMVRVGKKAAGRILDGRTWDEFPEVLR